MKSGIGSHTRGNRGATNDWITPPHILQALGEFDLDPCECVRQPWCPGGNFRTWNGTNDDE